MSHNLSMLEGSLATSQKVLHFNKLASSLIRKCSFLDRTGNGPPYVGGCHGLLALAMYFIK